ncbi:MAG TPA: hypothetical protein VEU96_04920, partial [Bryobacteraceae bacterium]|nr:hypothetical protein [Bryobacteraceae bacterium]
IAMKRCCMCLAVLGAGWTTLLAQTPATIDIDTSTTIPVNPRFSGYNDEVSEPIEYFDYRFNTLVSALRPGWVRFPGGISSDAYNWQTGQEEPSWVKQFASNATSGVLLPEMQKWLSGKGGGKFIDAADRANMLGARLIYAVNAFTETPQSIGQLAAYAKANGIPVGVWELCNEAYFFSDFFKGGADYLAKMKPFRDAIKAADPDAIVAVFFEDPARAGPNNPWDTALAAAKDKYWDAVTYHYYPPQSKGDISNWMADENGVLATNTNAYITSHLAPLNPPGMKFLVSEFNPSMGDAGGTLPTASLTNGTLYGGIYVAEFTMRMSTVPSVLYVGSHEISNFSGVDSSVSHYSDVTAAYNAGTSINTLSLNFGYFYGAQAAGVGIMNGVVNSAVKSNKTTVTGGITVPATGVGQIPALYAMAYTNAAGGLSVVVTNKSSTAHQITIRVNGNAAAGPFPIQFITGTDPGAMNTAAHPNSIAIQTATSANPVVVPAYSVLRADIAAPPVATLVNSASYQTGSLAVQQLVTAFGSGFASQTISAQAQPLPATLGDTSIAVTDSAGTTRQTPLFYVSPSQASFLLPDGMAAGAATVKVMRSGAIALSGSFNVAAVSPGIYAANGNGAGVPAATAQVGVTPLAVFSCQAGVALSCLATPLQLGAATDTVYVVLYGTGIRGAASVQAYVAGQTVPVLYAGAQGQFAGLDQINISLPKSLTGTGTASVYLIADGKMSNVVSLNIK